MAAKTFAPKWTLLRTCDIFHRLVKQSQSLWVTDSDIYPIEVPAERAAKELASRCGGARLASAIVDLPVSQGRCNFMRLIARLRRSGGFRFRRAEARAEA